MPFRITKKVLQFTWRRRTVDLAKEKLKGQFLKNIEHDLFVRGQMAAYMNSYRWLNRRQMENNVFLFWLCYKRNGKRCSCATMELWMHLGGLLSTQEARVSYASFVLSNLPHASITPWLHAAHLPFLKSVRLHPTTPYMIPKSTIRIRLSHVCSKKTRSNQSLGECVRYVC